MEEREFTGESKEVITVTVSAGVATYVPGMMDSAELIATADSGLYPAKEAGRKDILATLAKMKAAVKRGKENPESARTAGLDDFFYRVDDAGFMDVYRARIAAMILDMLAKK